MTISLNGGIILRAKRASFDVSQALARLRLAMKAYDPDQPRAPGGTEEGGQWIAVEGPLVWYSSLAASTASPEVRKSKISLLK